MKNEDTVITPETTLKFAEYYILKNDEIKLQQILTKIPFEKLDKNKSNFLLLNLLNICYKSNNKNSTPIIFDTWQRLYPNEIHLIPIFSLLFTVIPSDNEAFKFAILSFEDITFVEVIVDLINYDTTINAISACNLAIFVFGNQKYKTYEFLRDEAISKQNIVIEEFMSLKMDQTAPFQNKPKWVNNYLDKLPKENEYPIPSIDIIIELPPDTIALKLLEAKANDIGLTTGENILANEELKAYLDIATREEKLQLFQPILTDTESVQKELDYYRDLFRLFGPLNLPPLKEDEDVNNEEYRMLTCNIYDYDEEYDVIRPWFTGICDYCRKRIRYSWYAIRFPDPEGGFRGCYCSFECLNNDINNVTDETDIAESLIRTLDHKINEIGIQDRLPIE